MTTTGAPSYPPTPSPPSTGQQAARRRAGLLAASVMVLFVLAAAWALILSGREHERSAFDQNIFHLKAIQRFSAQWPSFRFGDYESATTPGYHVVLATLHRFLTHDLTTLRLAGSLFTAGLVATLACWLGCRLGAARAIALTLPLACSIYVFFPAVWLLPDNAAWWALTALLLVLLRAPGSTSPAGEWERGLLVAALLVLLVMVRQVHAWMVVPIAAAAWLAWPAERDDPRDPQALLAGLWPPLGERLSAAVRVVASGFVALPGLLVLALFVRLWGGLTPPAFQPAGSLLTTKDYTNVGGVSPATPGFILALIGLFGLFFAGFLWAALRRRAGPERGPDWAPVAGLAGLGALAGLVVSSLPHTSYLQMPRMSGLWNLVRAATPMGWDRSPVIIFPAMLGGAFVALWGMALPWRERWLLGATLAGFTLAHSAGALTWQRYFEPMVLLMLILSTASVVAQAPPPRPARAAGTPPSAGDAGSLAWWVWLGPLALALLQAGNTLWALR